MARDVRSYDETCRPLASLGAIVEQMRYGTRFAYTSVGCGVHHSDSKCVGLRS